MKDEDSHCAVSIAAIIAWFVVWMLVCSCTSYDHVAVAKNGNMVHDKIFKLGGAISARSSDGSSMVSDDQRSFQDAMAAAGLAVAAWGSVKNTASNNALNATKNTNATKQAISAGEQATRQAEISAKAAVTGEAIKSGAEVAPITISPP